MQDQSCTTYVGAALALGASSAKRLEQSATAPSSSRLLRFSPTQEPLSHVGKRQGR